MIMPGGLSSETKVKDGKFCVQTEFARIPKPRVTTTISRDGVVVRKVENAWERLPQTEEEKDKIERFLRRQHQDVISEITRGMDEPDASPGQADRIAVPDQALIGRIDQELSAIHGVTGWVHVSGDDRTVSHRLRRSEADRMSKLVSPLRDLSSLLGSVFGLGSLVGGILESPQNSELSVPLGAHFLVVKTDFRVNLKDLARRIRSVA